MPEAVRGILVTHGELGAELRRTAESILGPQDGLFALSNHGLSAEAFAERVRLLIPAGGRNRVGLTPARRNASSPASSSRPTRAGEAHQNIARGCVCVWCATSCPAAAIARMSPG